MNFILLVKKFRVLKYIETWVYWEHPTMKKEFNLIFDQNR